MSEINANIVVQPFDINITLDQPGITITPTVTDLNIYAVGGTNGVPAGNIGDLQYKAANGFAAIPTSVANFTGGNLRTNSSNLKISGGTNGYVLQTDGAGNVTWVAPSGSGNGVVGGANTQIQFNDAGLFGGNTGFTFDKSTGQVTIAANLTVGGDITGNASNANFAAYAGNVTLAAQPNITSVGNLLTLTVIGDSFTGPIYTSGVSGNITGANVISANTFTAAQLVTSNVANVTTLNATNAVVTTANITNANITTAVISTANVTNLRATTANVTTLTANGVVTLGSNANVRINGGSNGQYLTTNGSGNLSWTSPTFTGTTIANGTSNVTIPTANGNITMGVANVNRVTVASTGVTVVGNLSANRGTFTNGITVSGAQSTFNADVLINNTTLFADSILPIGDGNAVIGAASQRYNELWLDGNIEARSPGIANVGGISVHASGNATGNISAVNTISGNIVNFVSQLSSNLTPNTAVSTTTTHKIPIVLNGTTYYMMLTDTP